MDNLVFVDSNISEKNLVDTMVDTFASRPSLYDKYLTWISKSAMGYSNVVGDTTNTVDSGGGFGFNMGSITSLLGAGANIFATIKGSDAASDVAKAQAQAAMAAAQAQAGNNATALEIAKLQLQAAMAGKSGGNTMLYVGLGLGAMAVVGTVIYLIVKKK